MGPAKDAFGCTEHAVNDTVRYWSRVYRSWVWATVRSITGPFDGTPTLYGLTYELDLSCDEASWRALQRGWELAERRRRELAIGSVSCQCVQERWDEHRRKREVGPLLLDSRLHCGTGEPPASQPSASVGAGFAEGDRVLYWSSKQGLWLIAKVLSVQDDGALRLDVKSRVRLDHVVALTDPMEVKDFVIVPPLKAPAEGSCSRSRSRQRASGPRPPESTNVARGGGRRSVVRTGGAPPAQQAAARAPSLALSAAGRSLARSCSMGRSLARSVARGLAQARSVARRPVARGLARARSAARPALAGHAGAGVPHSDRLRLVAAIGRSRTPPRLRPAVCPPPPPPRARRRAPQVVLQRGPGGAVGEVREAVIFVVTKNKHGLCLAALGADERNRGRLLRLLPAGDLFWTEKSVPDTLLVRPTVRVRFKQGALSERSQMPHRMEDVVAHDMEELPEGADDARLVEEQLGGLAFTQPEEAWPEHVWASSRALWKGSEVPSLAVFWGRLDNVVIAAQCYGKTPRCPEVDLKIGTSTLPSVPFAPHRLDSDGGVHRLRQVARFSQQRDHLLTIGLARASVAHECRLLLLRVT